MSRDLPPRGALKAKHSTDTSVFSAEKTLDEMDGVSLSFEDWRFNLRKSNTEPLVRLNIESEGSNISLDDKVRVISGLLHSPK